LLSPTTYLLLICSWAISVLSLLFTIQKISRLSLSPHRVALNHC